jgi:predicted kinase
MPYVFGGLPGTGKSTLARMLARDLSAAYVRNDTVELRLHEAPDRVEHGPEGYRGGARSGR